MLQITVGVLASVTISLVLTATLLHNYEMQMEKRLLKLWEALHLLANRSINANCGECSPESSDLR